MPYFELDNLICKTMSRFQSHAADKQIHLQVVDDLASYVTLIGNARQFTYLMDMVFQNAINFSGASHISFSSRQLLRHGNEVLLEFLLEDNGLQHTGTRNDTYYQSLGIVQSLIEEMNGKSEIITVAGLSTTLKFILKCNWKEIDSKLPVKEGCAIACKGKKILVVEDNEINQHIITHLLSRQGIQTVVADDGKQAIEKLEQLKDIDLVIMDVNMPHMDGLQAANYIRKKLSLNLPIMGMITGNCPTDASQCLEVGMNQFIKKPFTVKELFSQVCSFFELDSEVKVEEVSKVKVRA